MEKTLENNVCEMWLAVGRTEEEIKELFRLHNRRISKGRKISGIKKQICTDHCSAIIEKWARINTLLAQINATRISETITVKNKHQIEKRKIAVAENAATKDRVKEFVFCTDNCIIDSRYDCSVSALYQAFIEWSKDVSCTIKRFSQCIKMIGGIGKIRKRDGIYLTGISLQK